MSLPVCYARGMDPLHATIEEFAAVGYTHVECYYPRCRVMRLRPISWLPRISLGLTIAQLSARLRCAECGGPVHSKYEAERILRQRELVPDRKLARRTFNNAAWALAFSVGTFIVTLGIFAVSAGGYRLP